MRFCNTRFIICLRGMSFSWSRRTRNIRWGSRQVGSEMLFDVSEEGVDGDTIMDLREMAW